MPDPPRKVLIIGGGTAGWMAAVMLSRTVGAATKVALIESEEIGTVGVGEATIPPVRKFNRFCGIDEAEFLRATQGTFKVGIQFEGWGRKGDRYLHAFGRVARELDAVVKMHFWWLLGRAAYRPEPAAAGAPSHGLAGGCRSYCAPDRRACTEAPAASRADAAAWRFRSLVLSATPPIGGLSLRQAQPGRGWGLAVTARGPICV